METSTAIKQNQLLSNLWNWRIYKIIKIVMNFYIRYLKRLNILEYFKMYFKDNLPIIQNVKFVKNVKITINFFGLLN